MKLVHHLLPIIGVLNLILFFAGGNIVNLVAACSCFLVFFLEY